MRPACSTSPPPPDLVQQTQKPLKFLREENETNRKAVAESELAEARKTHAEFKAAQKKVLIGCDFKSLS
jgi:hypothetical protein